MQLQKDNFYKTENEAICVEFKEKMSFELSEDVKKKKTEDFLNTIDKLQLYIEQHPLLPNSKK